MNRRSLMISVESRKGGVGKTTAALCLGRELLEHGYAVLVIDVDITGTNAADAGSSPFWKDIVHIVKSFGEESAANLLELFGRQHMAGLPVPGIVVDGSDVPLSSGPLPLVVSARRLNVLGSQIYSSKSKGPQRLSSCIRNPSQLFDDLHAIWMLDLLKCLARDFAKAVAGDGAAMPVAVVLDNSPGYVGISPSIHEWLTDLGPEEGKFLVVTSPDVQDTRSCADAVEDICSLYRSKWETSCQYQRAIHGSAMDGSDAEIKQHQAGFFMRLADTSPVASAAARGHSATIETELRFYHQKEDRDAVSVYVQDAHNYIGAIVNRVPGSVYRGRQVYRPRLQSGMDDESMPVILQLLGGGSSREWKQRMVVYSEYVEFQFLQLIHAYRQSPWLSQLMGTFDAALARLADINIQHGNWEDRPDNVLGACEALQYAISASQDIVNECLQALTAAGLDHLVGLIRPDWQPIGIVSGSRIALQIFMTDAGIPVHGAGEPFPADYASSINREFANRLYRSITDAIHEFGGRDDQIIVHKLVTRLVCLVFLSVPAQWLHSETVPEVITSISAAVLALQVRHWPGKKRGRADGSVQHFLAGERFRGPEDTETLMQTRWLRDFIIRGFPEDMHGFGDFYDACSLAQARLMDLDADARFLVELMQFMVRYERENPETTLPYVQDIGESIILGKSKAHDLTPEMMQQAVRSGKYLADFQRIVGSILRKWKVAL